MARTQRIPRKKRRTREHVIADLSANHFERIALLSGFTVERFVHDYGIDLSIRTYNEIGEIETGEILVQLKATDNLRVVAGRAAVAVRVEVADLFAWLSEPMPVMLVIYDASADAAYWLYVQAYFERTGQAPLRLGGETKSLEVPLANRVTQASLQQFASWRNRILGMLKGHVHHEE